MADQYEEYEDSSTYSEDDFGSGGEQIASAIYLNEQLAQQAAVIITKQNAVVLQPTTPPLNPKLKDMWIDTAIFPNVIYTWDGITWQRASVVSPDEIGTYDTVTIDGAIGQVALDTEAVSNRVEVNEGLLADGEGLSSKIIQSTTYATDVGGRIQDGVDGLVDSLQDDDSIAAKLPLMARQSDLTRKANEIYAAFTAGGGVNLLGNSAGNGIDGSNNLLLWQVVSGAATQYIGADAVDAGAGISISTGVIKQAVAGIAGQPFTLTCKVKKGTAGTAYVKLSDGNTFQQQNLVVSQAYDYVTVQIAGFIPATSVLIVELSATGASAIFTAIMLNRGTMGLQWSYSKGENYNGKVSFDVNGVKVQSSQYDGYTVMSVAEFAGYFRNNQGVMQKVFTLNKEFTEVAKLRITDANAVIQMGSIQVSYVNVSGNRGWAFLPSS